MQYITGISIHWAVSSSIAIKTIDYVDDKIKPQDGYVSLINTSQTKIVLPCNGDCLKDFEQQILNDAWQLGALDVRRLIKSALVDPDQAYQVAHGITAIFNKKSLYEVAGSDLIKVDSFDYDELEQINLAANFGYISWLYKPTVGCDPAFRDYWVKKFNLDANGYRKGNCPQSPVKFQSAEIDCAKAVVYSLGAKR
jgi:hypothetical protein